MHLSELNRHESPGHHMRHCLEHSVWNIVNHHAVAKTSCFQTIQTTHNNLPEFQNIVRANLFSHLFSCSQWATPPPNPRQFLQAVPATEATETERRDVRLGLRDCRVARPFPGWLTGWPIHGSGWHPLLGGQSHRRFKGPLSTSMIVSGRVFLFCGQPGFRGVHL